MAAQVCLCELLLFSFSWLVENESCWVAEGDLDLPAATSQVLGLQICASHPALTALANYSWQVESSSSFFFFKTSAAEEEDLSLHKGIVCRCTLHDSLQRLWNSSHFGLWSATRSGSAIWPKSPGPSPHASKHVEVGNEFDK